MSDNSENGVESDTENSSVCRDFLRNVCRRGKRCKYRHPENKNSTTLSKVAELTFCHDYQNTGCRRVSCKFLHCTREEEEYYKQTGQLPVRLQQAAALGIGIVPTENAPAPGEVPICKDYLKGECKRGVRCKYRHLKLAEYEYELRRKDRVANRLPPLNSRFDTFNEDLEAKIERLDRLDRFEQDFLTLKRKRIELDEYDLYDRYASPPNLRSLTDYQLLEEENLMLRRKIDDLKKQVSDLTATNDVLLEQNARYRTSKANQLLQGLQVQSVSVPQPPTVTMVTVCEAVTPTVAPAPVVQRSGGPQPLSVLNSQLPHVTLTTPDLAQQTSLQQHLAQELNQQQAGAINVTAINPPPCSISGSIPPVSVSMAQQIATVSIAPVSMSQNMPRQNMAQAINCSMPSRGINCSVPSSVIAATYAMDPITSHSLTNMRTEYSRT
ncbi:unnamed protein product [Owenia fusiformis]|uniref:Uncharacterized protein n=1 Tax=Owenia fusiformis TaxID=6347 RepID=A0A8J1UFC1_OWEFU|nr:unnamed protein product [Owenia fusiformis]